MQQLRRTMIVFVTAVLLATVFMMSLARPAQAHTLPTTAIDLLVTQSMHPYAYSAPQFPNPYGCNGRADNPHLSLHYPGTVIASGWTICNTGGLYLKVTAALFRQDCAFGWWPCWWTQLDQTVNTSPRTLASSVATTPQANCNNSSTHLYALVISAEVWDWSNQWYGGTTGRQAQVDCG